jgi:maleylpyruvate isomerase
MMRLYAYYRSSASYRVRLALMHKQIAYELVPVSIVKNETHSPEHLARNPLGQVPVLEIQTPEGPVYLAQSLAIIEYLDELHPERPLLPRDPILRARARELAEIVNSGTQPLQNTPVLTHVEKELHADAKAWARRFMHKGLSALEARAKHTSGQFLVGDAPTVADVLLVPQMYNARRFELSLDAFPTLVAIDARCQELPNWALAHPDRQPDAPSA